MSCPLVKQAPAYEHAFENLLASLDPVRRILRRATSNEGFVRFIHGVQDRFHKGELREVAEKLDGVQPVEGEVTEVRSRTVVMGTSPLA